MLSASSARLPKTTLVAMSAWVRSLMGMEHCALVVLMARRVSFRVQVVWMQVLRRVVRAGVVQIQVAFVGAQRGWVLRVVVKHVAWRCLAVAVRYVVWYGGLMIYGEPIVPWRIDDV